MQCDALLLDAYSQTDTYPKVDVAAEYVDLGHEASVGKISDDQLFYVMSRGFSQQKAHTMIVNGFIDVLLKNCLWNMP